MRETSDEVSSAAGRNLFVLGGTTLLLRTLSGRQVTETGRAAQHLAFGSQFEALGDGFLGLLHEKS